MEFCERCRGMIVVKDNKTVCASCGLKLKKRPKLKTSEKIEEKDTVAVIKGGQDEVYPIIEMKCPQCKNKKCYFWTLQTRSSDESETKFYKCTKCKHTWRVYR